MSELESNDWAMAWRSLATGAELHPVMPHVYVNFLEHVTACRWLGLGVLKSEAQDVEELGKGVEGAVRVLGVLNAVKVVHVVSANQQKQHPSCRASATRLKFHTDAAAPKHMARWNRNVKPCSV